MTVCQFCNVYFKSRTINFQAQGFWPEINLSSGTRPEFDFFRRQISNLNLYVQKKQSGSSLHKAAQASTLEIFSSLFKPLAWQLQPSSIKLPHMPEIGNKARRRWQVEVQGWTWARKMYIMGKLNLRTLIVWLMFLD